MKFSSIKEAMEYGKDFGKHDWELVEIRGDKYLLCGTPMVTEDLVCGLVEDLISGIRKSLYDNNEEIDVDLISELRDDAIDVYLRSVGVKDIIYISETY